MKKIIFALFCIIGFHAYAQVADTDKKKPADSIKNDALAVPDTVQHLHSKPISWLVPGGLVAYGGLSFAIKPVRNIDYYFKGVVARSAPNYNSKAADYLQVAPGVLVYGLNLFGVEGKNRFVDRTVLLVLSGGILTFADGLKYLTHRNRPYGTSPLSFPSGHTGAAFVAAEFLAQEYSWKSPWYGIIGYTMATTTGILRIYGRDHWFSDCVAGAGFGILSVKTAYWLYPHIRSVFSHKNKRGGSTMIMPSYQYGVPGFSFAMQL